MNAMSPVAAGAMPAATNNVGFGTKCLDAAKSGITMVGNFFASIRGFVMNHKVATGVVLAVAVLAFAAYFFGGDSCAVEDGDATNEPAKRTPANRQGHDHPRRPTASSSAAAGGASRQTAEADDDGAPDSAVDEKKGNK